MVPWNKVLNTFITYFLISGLLPAKNISEKNKDNIHPPVYLEKYNTNNINKIFLLSSIKYYISPFSQSNEYVLNEPINFDSVQEDLSPEKHGLLKKLYLDSISGISNLMEYIQATKLRRKFKDGFIQYKNKQVQLGYNYRMVEIKFIAGARKWDDPNFVLIYGAEYDRIFGITTKFKYLDSTFDMDLEKGDLENRINFKASKIFK